MPIAAQHLKAARLHLQKADPEMKRILKQIGPCQLKTRRDRFEVLVDSIVSQQISGAAARTILGRLKKSVAPDKLSPDSLSHHSLDSLRELGVSRQKGSYVLDLIDKVNSGQLVLKTVSRLADDEIIKQLTQVKGIGVWTAQMFLMFCLGRLDVFPAADLGIQNAIKENYEVSEEPTTEELMQIAEPWRPYRTIASWYLWRSLDSSD